MLTNAIGFIPAKLYGQMAVRHNIINMDTVPLISLFFALRRKFDRGHASVEQLDALLQVLDEGFLDVAVIDRPAHVAHE